MANSEAKRRFGNPDSPPDTHSRNSSPDLRPEADEDKRLRTDGAGVEDRVKRKQAVDPALMPGGDPAGAA